jgi:KaiC/GvpD/RAD55 family RecA-like ATPase
VNGYVTLWATLKTPTGRHVERDWDEVFEQFSRRVEFRHDLHPGWSPSVFEDDYRELARVQRVFAMVLDIDEPKEKYGTVGWTLKGAQEAFDDFYGLIHTSKSHSATLHRFRVILPTNRPMSAFEYSGIWRRLDARFPHRLDPQAKDPSRFWYTPGVVGGGPFETTRLTGEPLNVDKILAWPEPEQTTAPAPEWRQVNKGADVEDRARKYIAKMDPGIAGSGGHDSTWRVAVALAQGFELSEEDTFQILKRDYNPRCSPPWSDRELRHKARQAVERSTVTAGYLLSDNRGLPPEAHANWSPNPPQLAAPAEERGVELMREPGDDSEETLVAQPAEGAWQRFGARRVADTMQVVWEEQQRKEPPPSVSTTHAELDRVIGGFRRGFNTVLGATTNWGKTSFTIAVVDEALRAGKRGLIVSCEDVEVVYGRRLASRRSGLNAMKMRDATLSVIEKDRLFEWVNAAEEIPWFLPAIGKSAEWIAAAITALCAEWDYDIVVVDYLQKVHTKAQDRRNEVSRVSDLIGSAIKQGNAAGLLLSQIKRLESGKQPGKHDLKESGDIENAAEHILIGCMGKSTDSYSGKQVEQRYLKVDKNKDGPQFGDPIWMQFEESTASFRNVGQMRQAVQECT